MATPNLGYQNKFSTTLSSGIVSTDTTIPLTTLPTPSEGYLILEPDSSAAWEEIYYTSKTGSAVVCPSVALGRGVGGSTGATHASGATVRMDSSAELFTTLQDTTALTGLHTMNTERGFDFVASGCVWSGDSYASTLNGSMTSGVAYINGRRHTVAAITAHVFSASKDTYVDLLYSTADNIATPVYTAVSNNAASPALAANSIRIAIIVTGGSSIAAAGSVNQGLESAVLPIVSSVPYAVTDSLGNLICCRDSQHRTLGYRQITSQFSTAATSATQVTGLSCPVIVPANRRIVIEVVSQDLYNTTSARSANLTLWSGTVGSGTQLGGSLSQDSGTSGAVPGLAKARTTTTGSVTYNAGLHSGTSGTSFIDAGSTVPAYIWVGLA